MNLFEKVKDNVTVVDAAMRYGLEVKRNGMTRCPFHDDHTPSLKLNWDYFYCFGCGAKGDVIDFTARLYDLSLTAAARKLAADFGVDASHPGSPTTVRYQITTKNKMEETLCRSMLAEHFRLLREWKTRYAPQSPDEVLDDRFVEALKYLDYTEYLLDVFDFGSPAERAEIVKIIKEKEVVCA